MTDFIAISGRLTEDPTLRFIQSGAAVVDVNIAHNHRKNVGGTWEDDGATFIRATIWREHAENVAGSLNKGDEVLVIGELKQRSWESNGEKRSTYEIQAESITPVLKYATAKVTRVTKSANGGFASAAGVQANDPWASAPSVDSEPAPW